MDYILVPYSNLDPITDFCVKTVTGLIQEFSVQPPSRNVPDHSVLLCTLELSGYIKDNLYLPKIPTEHPVNGIQNTDVPCRKYSVDSVPINIFDSARCCSALVNVINMLQRISDCRKTVNEAYEKLFTVIHAEMDALLNYKDIGPTALKKKKHMGKPWWDDNLQKLWNNVRSSERFYLKFHGCRRERVRLKSVFTDNRNIFDRHLRQCERRYRAAQRDKLLETH